MPAAVTNRLTDPPNAAPYSSDRAIQIIGADIAAQIEASQTYQRWESGHGHRLVIHGSCQKNPIVNKIP